MRKKNLFTAMMCAVCLGATAAAAPLAVMAEETELVTEAADTEAEDAEESTEASSEESTEEEFVKLERPEYEASGYVELGEYKGLTVTKVPVEVTDEEVAQQIRANAGSDILEEFEEGTVGEGDIANIDYEGKLDGEAFDGGTAKGYDLEIGSHSFIDGFEDGLVGVAVGDTVDLPLTFPENYVEDLAGKEVVFTVTVNSVKRVGELTAELVEKITDGEYTEVDAYRESVRGQILENKQKQEENAVKQSLLQQVAAASKVKDYPQEMLDYSIGNMKNYYKQTAEMSGMELADFLQAYMGMTEEEFGEQVELAVKQNLQLEMYLLTIAETEGLEVSEEEFAARCEEYAAMNNFASVEELKENFDELTLRVSALQDKTLDFLVENAEIVEAEKETEIETEAESAAEETTEAQSGAEETTEAQSDAETEEVTEAVSEAE